MSRRNTVLLAIGAVALAVLLLLLLVQSTGPEDESIIIAAALPLSGDNASWGEQARDGINLAIQQRRPQVGVRVVYEDTKGTPDGGSAAIRALLSQNRPVAVIGGITGGATAAMAPICAREQVPLLSPTASADSLSDAGPWFYRVWPRDAFETETFAAYLAEEQTRSVAVLYIQNEYGVGVRDAFHAAFERAGGTIILSSGYASDETNFRPTLTRIQAEGAVAVYIAGYYKDASLIVTQSAQMGANLAFFGTTTVGDSRIIDLAGEAANGLTFSQLVAFEADITTSAEATQFVQAFEQSYGRTPGWAEAHGYDCAAILLSGLPEAFTDGTGCRGFLDDLEGYRGVTGTITFDDKGDVRGAAVAIKRINEKQIETLTVILR